MDLSIQQQLLEIVEKIDRPGTFCTSGPLPPTLPGLSVTGVGPVALPLEKRLAEALKKRARQAPYGKGTKTLVDTGVRRVWEIDADQIVLANPQWRDVLKQAVGAAQSELGLENQNLEAHLYRLLLYESGSFFLAHRDGEKLDRMVATLVIALPSAHEGGELVVRHEGREEAVDFGTNSQFQTQFAAFYADCEHEIRPVTSGFRLALVYNLTLEKSSASDHGSHQSRTYRCGGRPTPSVEPTETSCFERRFGAIQAGGAPRPSIYPGRVDPRRSQGNRSGPRRRFIRRGRRVGMRCNPRPGDVLGKRLGGAVG